MALQSSGSISISQIKSEVGGSSSSLRSLSNAAGKSAPDGMQEFYGYSHVTLTSFSASINSNFGAVCSESIVATYYHDDPTFPYPDSNNTVYLNSNGSSYLPAGYYKLGSGDYMRVGTSGSVMYVNPCGFP
jgi:uncharacterized protein YqkB